MAGNINQAMKLQLIEKGESTVGDMGIASRLLLKNSDLHEVQTQNTHTIGN